MSPERHTPGPWEIDRTKNYYKPCIRHNGTIVAYMADNGSGHVREADKVLAEATDEINARLIAAAPEMLALLKGLVQDWQEMGLVEDDTLGRISGLLAKIEAP